MKSYMNWSGGKDSALAFYKLQQQKSLHIDSLLTSVNSVYDRISMHGVRRSLLLQQAEAMAIPLHILELPEQPGMKAYETIMNEKLVFLKKEGYDNAVFGDIFLEDLKLYREKQLAQHNITCSFPLWKIKTTNLLKEFLQLGFKTIIVCVNEEFLDKSFCGRVIDDNFINELPANVDPCGENGEFHTFVFDGPIFKAPIGFIKGVVTYKKYTAPKNDDSCFTTVDKQEYGFYFCDLLPLHE